MEVVIEKTASEQRVQFLDTTGRPLGSDVSAIAWTLYNDDVAGTVINSRSAVAVLNANGGTYTPTLSLTNVKLLDPVRVTAAAHGLRDGDLVYISGIVGTTELNLRVFEVRRYSDDEFTLHHVRGGPVCGKEFTAYTSGGTAKVGLFVLQLTPDDNQLIGTVAAGGRQKHFSQLVVTAGGIATRIEKAFEVRQRQVPA